MGKLCNRAQTAKRKLLRHCQTVTRRNLLWLQPMVSLLQHDKCALKRI
jgi:hypothetical protein